jgi:hypothetical protein
MRNQIRKYHLVRNGPFSDWTDSWVSCKCIETDMIMRLTKVDEDKSGYHTIHSVWKTFDKVNKSSSDKAKIRNLMKSYRKSINQLKTKYRNIKLAHLSTGNRDSFNTYIDFSKHIAILADIIDLFNGEEMRYIWKENGEEIDLILDTNRIMKEFRNDIKSGFNS